MVTTKPQKMLRFSLFSIRNSMQIHLYHYYLLQIFLIAGSRLFAGDEPPAWVKSGRDARFPERLYIQAVGQAAKQGTPDEDRARAEAEARKQIAQYLQVNITSKNLVIKFESQTGETFQEQSLQKMLEETKVTLSGSSIEGYYFDKKQKTYYALAVLDRRIASKAMHTEMLALKNGAANALAAAAALMDSSQSLHAIAGIRRAYQLLQAMNDRQQILSVLQASQVSVEAIPAQPNVEQVLHMLDKAIRAIRIEARSTTTLTSRSQLPLKVEAMAQVENSPLENVLLVCSFRQGRGRARVSAPTGKDGRAVIMITELGPAPNGEYAIEVAPDVSELLLSTDQSGKEDWNAVVRQALHPAGFTLKRTDVDLADYCAGAAAELAARLPSAASPFHLALGNITYEETGAASAFVAYLKEQIASEFSLHDKVKLTAPEKIEQSLRAAPNTYRGSKRPDLPEILAENADANGIFIGKYWDRGEVLEFNLQIIQQNSAAMLATTTMKFAKSLIPPGQPYLPDNYSDFSKANALGNFKSSKEDLQVEVWVDRGDGAIYRAGEKVAIFVRATQDSYLYLIYHDAGGNDVLIYPNARQANNRILGGVIYQIPDARDSFDFAVQEPFGSELLKAVVAKETLPELPGKILPNGLKLLAGSYKDNLVRLRELTMQARMLGYAEGSCVVTSVE
jgi:hypothetical protein